MTMDSIAAGKENVPDFAFPEKVEVNADVNLKKALADSDDVGALEAAIQIIAARNSISSDSFTRNAALLDSLSNCMKAPYSQLALLLEAGLYRQLYEVSPWQYNGRTLPLDTYPENPTEWSKDLFAKKVLSLVDAATADMSAAKTTPLSAISRIILPDESKAKGTLSVADFIVVRSASVLTAFGSQGQGAIIPFFDSNAMVAATIGEQCSRKAMQLLDNLVEWRETTDDPVALVSAIIQKNDYLSFDEKHGFLEGWISRLSDTEAVGALLNEYMNYIPGDSSKEQERTVWLYGIIKKYLERYPGSTYADILKYDLKKLTSQQATITLPSTSISGKPAKGKLSVANMNTAYLLLYSVPESIVPMNSLIVKDFPAKAKFIKAIKVNIAGEAPFKGEQEFELPSLTPGYYVAIPSAKPTLASNWKNEVERWSIGVLNVTDISIIISKNSKEEGSGRIYVVDALTQRPISGATVKFYPDNRVKNPTKTLLTDKEGSVAAPEGFLRVRASKGNNVMWQYSDINYRNTTDENTRLGRIFTDLSIYRPGDKVQFSVVVWDSKAHANNLVTGKEVKMTLRDANWKVVDTLSVTTDRFGRANGSFNLPGNGLLGRYSLAVSDPNDTGDEWGGGPGDFAQQGFQVAEYKTPTFFVAVTSESDEVVAPGAPVKFKGEVKTYSGMSLGGSEVKYTVNWNQWWRWWGNGIENATYNGMAQVDEDGKFEIELPTANLKDTPFERGIFTLTATVTSPSGETQESSPLSFVLREGFSITPAIQNDRMLVTGDTVKLDVPVYDMLGHPAQKTVDYTVVDEAGKDILNGSFVSPVLEIASDRLPSGKYEFKFKLPGDTLTTDNTLILWRKTDKHTPWATPLWVPEREIVVAEGDSSAEITVGSGYTGSWILCQISDESRILQRKWVVVNGENVKVNVPVPEGKARYWVTFAGMHSHAGETARVTLVPVAATKKMSVKTLSFRDKISAGDREKWSFSFKVDDAAQPGIPAMAVMSNKALDALQPFAWNFSLGGDAWYDYSSLRTFNVGIQMVTGKFTKLSYVANPSNVMLQWNTYNQLLAGGNSYGTRIRGMNRMMKAAPAAGAIEMETDGVVMEEAQVFMAQAAPPMAAKADMVTNEVKMAMDDSDMALAESEVTAEGGNSGAPAEKVKPRPVEMPLAFFMPSLNADAEGNVNVEFITPNFNTTWKFQVMGYNEQLLSAGTVLEAVASKPVMVQANPPRYLRTGDKATVSAVLFNNSPDTQMLHGEIIIFNPLTGETLTSYHLGEEATEPGGNRTMMIDFPVPGNITAVGMKAYAYGGDYADGEQTLIPVLPSSTPVVESVQFYLGDGKNLFSKKLPKFRKDASLTLKYCDNPVWECVMALPSISKPESKSVLSISRALYANGMAKGIVGKYPAVKSGLEQLFESSKEVKSNTLVSNLQKDSLLKTVALVNTPWVNNASAETMRLESLKELLDSKKIDDAIYSLADQLSTLQNPDGGWSWCEGMRSSDFITTLVLSDLASLPAVSTLPKLNNAISKAVAYCDKDLYDSYVENDKKFSTISLLRYLYVRSKVDKGNGKSGFAKLKKEALQAIDKEWKDFSIYDKATAAILLSENEGYENTSRLILESLRQLASKSESKGWWYDNLGGGWNGMPKLTTTARVLEAFAAIEPQSEAVDGLRQWLVLQKETEDWGDNSYTTEIINAILASGTDWTAPTGSPVLRLDGKVLEVADKEMLTGIVTLDLDPKAASGKTLTIEKGGEAPAWGGVISQFIQPMNEVKAEKCENLRIEKQILLVEENDGQTSVRNIPLSGKESLKPGDKVRVTLTITCGKDMDYVAVIDERSACLEPADQISGYKITDGLGVYREIRDTKTSFFIGYLPKGVNVISYDCYVDREGEYALGIASAQSQYSPLQAAHSAGGVINVKK